MVAHDMIESGCPDVTSSHLFSYLMQDIKKRIRDPNKWAANLVLTASGSPFGKSDLVERLLVRQAADGKLVRLKKSSAKKRKKKP